MEEPDCVHQLVKSRYNLPCVLHQHALDELMIPICTLYKNNGIAYVFPELYIKSSATALGFTPLSSLYLSPLQ